MVDTAEPNDPVLLDETGASALIPLAGGLGGGGTAERGFVRVMKASSVERPFRVLGWGAGLTMIEVFGAGFFPALTSFDVVEGR